MVRQSFPALPSLSSSTPPAFHPSNHHTSRCPLPITNGFETSPLAQATHSFEYLRDLWDASTATATGSRTLSTNTILPAAGVADTSAADIDDIFATLTEMQAAKAGVHWSPGSHTARNINLHGYAVGEKRRRQFKAEMGGNHDNTELPRYVERVLGLNMDETTRKLRAATGGGS